MEEKSIIDLLGELRRRTRKVDLAPRHQSDMPKMSVHPDLVVLHDARSHERHGYYANHPSSPSTTAPTVDAPIHVHPEMADATIEDVTLDQLIGLYKKFDLSRLDPQPGQLVTRAQLRQEEERSGFSVEAGDIVLVDFGWSRFYLPDEPDWERRRYWADFNAGLDEDACDHGEILAEFGHRTYFLPNGILIGEGFENLAKTSATGQLLALPLRIERGSGSPLRPVAIFEP